MAPKAVLIGLPGSGKSTIGRRLAKAMGCSLIDTDAAIEERTGRTIAEIFASEGESGFRKIEVLTQYNSHRLLEHLQFGWTFLSGRLGEFVHVTAGYGDVNAIVARLKSGHYRAGKALRANAIPKTIWQHIEENFADEP